MAEGQKTLQQLEMEYSDLLTPIDLVINILTDAIDKAEHVYQTLEDKKDQFSRTPRRLLLSRIMRMRERKFEERLEALLHGINTL